MVLRQFCATFRDEARRFNELPGSAGPLPPPWGLLEPTVAYLGHPPSLVCCDRSDNRKKIAFRTMDQPFSERLRKLAKAGDVRRMKSLLHSTKSPCESDGNDSTWVDSSFLDAALITAASYDHPEACKFLCQVGANKNCSIQVGRKTVNKLTPLTAAASRNSLHSLAFLLDAGAKVDTRDSFGRTPLIVAASKKHRRASATLLRHGASVNAQSTQGISALMAATDAGALGVAELLLEEQAEVNLRDVNGASALQYAVKRGYEDMCLMLLERGADANSCNARRTTVLMIAANCGYNGVCEILVEYGADILRRNEDGVDAFDCAKDADIYKFLSDSVSKAASRAGQGHDRGENSIGIGSVGNRADGGEESGDADCASGYRKQKPQGATGSNGLSIESMLSDAAIQALRVVEEIEERRARRDGARRKEGSSSSSNSSTTTVSKMADKEGNDDGLCVVCFENAKDATIVHGDTGHMATCLRCARILQRRGDGCPICRAKIDHVIRQFNV